MASQTQATICVAHCSGLRMGGRERYVAVLLQRAWGVSGITPSLVFLLPRLHDSSNKNTADIKSPYSRRAGIISFSIINITTVIHEYRCFLHHFK